jgi:hypothetical protein
MKRITLIFLAIVVIFSLAAYIFKAEDNKTPITPKVPNQALQAPKTSHALKETKISFEKYFPLIGMSKAKLIETLKEKPTKIDEGGLEFKKSGLRVWFDAKENKYVEQFCFTRSDIDFNGLKIGDQISSFEKVFGKPTHQDIRSAYATFNYKNLVIDVDYDPKTKKSVAVYVLKEWR